MVAFLRQRAVSDGVDLAGKNCKGCAWDESLGDDRMDELAAGGGAAAAHASAGISAGAADQDNESGDSSMNDEASNDASDDESEDELDGGRW